MRALWLFIVFLFTLLSANAQTVNVGGKISDADGNVIEFASVWIEEIQTGTVANIQGMYHLNLPPGLYTLAYRAPGFKPEFKKINIKGIPAIISVKMKKTEKLFFKSTEADSLIKAVIIHRKQLESSKPIYSGTMYRKAIQRLIRIPKVPLKNALAHELHLNSTRVGIINLSESIATFRSRAENYYTEEVIAAKKASNSINVFNFERSPDLQIDLNQNMLQFNGFNEHGFVSPIADNASKFYRFELTSKFIDQGKTVNEIKVNPKYDDEHVFSGYLYIVANDSSLYGVSLKLTKKARLNFVDSVNIHQQFVPLKNNKWESQGMRFSFWGKFWHLQYSGSFLQVFEEIHTDTGRNDHPPHEVYKSTGDSYKKDEGYWHKKRPVLLSPEEDKFYLLTSLIATQINNRHIDDSLKNKNNKFQVLPFLLRGITLHNYEKNTSWTFQTPYNAVFFNTVEGWGIDLKVRYNKQYDSIHSLSIIPEIRYGFTDKVWNYNVFVNYGFNPFSQSSLYAKAGSDFLDLNKSGTISLFLNSISTLFLGSNYLKLYQSRFFLTGIRGEVANGVLLNGEMEFSENRSLFNTTKHTFNKDSTFLTSNNPLDPNADIALFPHYRSFTLRGSATFTFDQEYMVTPSGKFILPNPYPRIRVNYRTGIPVPGSDVNYNFASFEVFQDRVNLGIYGHTAYFVSAGGFLSAKKLYYPDYMQFSGGQSFFFNASSGSFHFLNYYTYSTNKAYFEAHIEHDFAGYFTSHVPLLKRFNIEEIIGASYLSQGTLPDYKEVYFGLKRTIVRLDYGFAFGRYSNKIQGFRLVYSF